ncbi:MAG: T9SS type A sorting domain-containing protein [Bacteroidota bacterium]
MKQIYSFIVFSVILFLPIFLYSQNNLVLPEYSVSGRYLNDQIAADTAADGTHDTTRVYVLNRNGLYKVNGSINNNGWTLRIRASYDAGFLPYIILVPGSGQTLVPAQMILAGGKVYLTNLQVSGYNETVPSTISTMNVSIVTNNATNNDIVVDSCIFSNVVRGILWMNINARFVKVTHSIFANNGYLGNNDIGNGRAIDLRAGSCDTLFVQNNTFVNTQDRLIRHYVSTGPLKYFLFDHNTVVNNMSFHGFIGLGLMNAAGGSQAIITNNLLLDPFALGNDTDAVRQVEFADNHELDTYGRSRMVWFAAIPEPTTQWTIQKNYYGISAEQQAFYDANASAGVTGEGLALPWHINAKIGIDSQTAFVKVPLTMTKAPAVMTAMMNWYRSPTGAHKTKLNSSWTLAYDWNRISYVYLTDTLNCNFKCNTNLSAAATDAKVIGDTRWSWTGAVGVENAATQVPAKFSLDQNYPNPFNPSTNFTFSVAKTGLVSLKVYDLLGREVATLVNEVKEAGNYPIEWNAAGFGSGIYFCKMQSGSFTATKKMILMK